MPARAPRIKFAVIGVNHAHVHRQVEAVIRGGGQFVSFFAKEPDLAEAFAKRYPQAKLARSEKEILESDVQLIASAGIPDERAPLGIQAMRHGKDYMSDKPGMTTLAAAGRGPQGAGPDQAHLLDHATASGTRTGPR